jgi:hypothetical protein
MAIAISECRNAKYVRSDNSLIDVEINHPEFGWIPYTINDDDTDTTINNASLKTLIGSDIAAFTGQTDKNAMISLRSIRNGLLEGEVDPIVSNPLRWDALSTSKQNEWKAYRTALLDITAQSGAPQSVTWPTKPS